MALTFEIDPPRLRQHTGFMIGLVMAALCTGCSIVNDRTENYVNEPEGRPLELTESADKTRFNEIMPVREVVAADAGRMYEGELPQPPDMTSEILDENYVIEAVDDEVWLLVNEVPGRLWPEITAYMNRSGLGVAHESPQSGLLQSELVNYSKRARSLLELPDNPEGEEQLKIVQAKVSPGVRRKTTEIQFRALPVESGGSDQFLGWSEQPGQGPQSEVRRRLLADLANFLKAREDSKSYSRAALGMDTNPLVRLISENDQATRISMKLDYGRSWAEVRRALDEAALPVLDLNREQGYFFVDFRPKSEREPGWFFWLRDDPEPVRTMDLSLENQGDKVVVTASPAPDYSGEDRTADLLSKLFDHLY